MKSLTHAIKAKNLLLQHGIESRVVKPNAQRTEKGCGYGVAVSVGGYVKAKSLLTENGLPPLELG